MRALAEGQRVQLVERAQELAQLRAVPAAASTSAVGGPSSRRSATSSTSSWPVATIALTVSSRCARSNFAIRRDPQDLQRIEPPRAGGHHPDERDVVVRVRDRAQRLLQVADLRRLEQAQAADDGVRDVLVAQPRHDRLAVLVLAVQDGDVGPRCRRSPPRPAT